MGDFVVVDKLFRGVLSNVLEDYPEGLVLSLDKPYRWTSADAVRKIKFMAQRHFRKKNIKVGHAGTLDPLATGILLICIGRATKCAEMLQNTGKEYIASVRLGATTPSYDLEKEVDAIYPYTHITEEMVRESIKGFIGEQLQVPPIFSAKLVDGTRAYEIARAGESVELKASKIVIHDMELLGFDLPVIKLRIRCSKGTYIRAIARDIGTALGSGGHLIGLQRSASGTFVVGNALTMDDIAGLL